MDKASGDGTVDVASSWQYVFRIKTSDIFVRAVLQHMYDWPIEIALNGLEQCIDRLEHRPHLRIGIEELYRRILVYYRVSEVCEVFRGDSTHLCMPFLPIFLIT